MTGTPLAMRILVVGSGGREHALVWKIAQSPLVTKVYAAPGNAGIARQAECVDITIDNLEGLADFAAGHRIDLTVVGPEAPLCRGLVDLFNERKLRIFGPTKAAAELEGSKIFCKELLRRFGIPTAGFRVFNDATSARVFLKTAPFPLVVKADGLAGGKGAVVCSEFSEAEAAVEQMMVRKAFGPAGERILVEEFLSGVEASVISFTDSRSIAIMEAALDHKRVYDGDRGPNTGGMGACSPAPVAPDREVDRVEREILVPVVHAMNKEQRRFQGILYAGIMYTKSGPKVIEFNVRHGDPECQPLLMRLKSDLVPILNAVIDGKLEQCEIEWDPRPAVCVVAASGGYPGRYEVGYEIAGLDEAEAMADTVVFHAGTMAKNGKVVTSGGRVLGITARGENLKSAQQAAYAAARKVSFTGMHFRTDIGNRLLK
jgi:phosphoribosylamine--glycine ligase